MLFDSVSDKQVTSKQTYTNSKDKYFRKTKIPNMNIYN